MNNSQFCHLHVHDQYSQLDGIGTAEEYAKQAKQLGFQFLGLTNHGNVDGLIQLQKACDKEGVGPVLGCELYVVKNIKEKTSANHMTVFVKDDEGWQNLLQILSYANLQGFYRKPRVDCSYFLDHCEGLVLLTGCCDTFLCTDWGLSFLDDLDERMSWDLYFEVMPHNIDSQIKANQMAIKCAYETVEEGLIPPLVATNDCHYIEEDDWEAQEVLLAIQRGAKWSDKDRWRFNIKGLYLKSEQEMVKSFEEQGVLTDEEIDWAMEKTLEVAEKCSDFRIKKQNISLPIIGKEKENPDELLWRLCNETDRVILTEEGEWAFEYWERFQEEYNLVVEKKFSQYFIIVKEIVDWCKDNAILVGPGRGSVGGCLLAYLLGITLVDPIKYGLLFSRFIAPDRIDYPDIDLDFEHDKRHLVMQHLKDLYGVNNVANIVTFLRMKGRGAVRDVCRVFETPLTEADSFAKSIDDSGEVRENTRIREAVKNTEIGNRFARKYPKVIQVAQKIEGQVRGYGKHAAGMIVSSENLTDGTRCNLIRGNNEDLSINWEMNDAEYVGLMKLDILALSTMTIFGECVRLIKENNSGLDEFELEKIPLDDPKVYKDLSEGNTIGVFQFTGYASTQLIKKMGVEKFEDLAVVTSLARPGPSESGMLDLFVERKKGKKWNLTNDAYDKITKETYGVLVYQEQVMQVISEVAGLSYATSDRIRKIIAKTRSAREFEPYRVEFIEGCKKQKTFSEKQANKFWEGLLQWAGYGFNKAHAIEYAMIGYWSAWLKLNYPKEFLCAALTYEPDSKKNGLVKEAYRLGFEVMTPKVGISDPLKWIAKGTVLYAPFISIKSIGEKKAIAASGFRRVSSKQGFFKIESTGEKKSQLEILLEEVGAFGPGIPDGASKHFRFTISNNPTLLYSNMFKLFPILRPNKIDDALKAKVRIPGVFKKIRFNNSNLLQCQDCELRKEARAPVMPSKGLYNIALAGEAPGRNEDLEGIGFVGKTGDEILWPEFEKYGLKRIKFHITNIVKCYPRLTKTPDKIHIQKCLSWFQEELKFLNCRLVLGFGNTCVKAFLDEDGGIKKLNGTTQWLDRWQFWVCWSIHPAAVIYNPHDKELFQQGIRNFIDTLKSLGDFDEILF